MVPLVLDCSSVCGCRGEAYSKSPYIRPKIVQPVLGALIAWVSLFHSLIMSCTFAGVVPASLAGRIVWIAFYLRRPYLGQPTIDNVLGYFVALYEQILMKKWTRGGIVRWRWVGGWEAIDSGRPSRYLFIFLHMKPLQPTVT